MLRLRCPPRFVIFCTTLALGFIGSCATQVNPGRTTETFTRPNDGQTIKCPKPPEDVIAKAAKFNADMAAVKIGNILKASAGVEIETERIRQELPSDVAAFEVVEYRICAQYGNGVLTAEQYKTFTEKILPQIKPSTIRSRSSGFIPQPTPDNKVGIWVAQIRGDDDELSAQREIKQKLGTLLRREPSLDEDVEVRELPQEIHGASEDQKLAIELTIRYNAAMIVWGEIVSGFASEKVFWPRITFSSSVQTKNPTIDLQPVSADSERDSYRINALGAASLSPERIQEPFKLARFIVAYRHYQKADWSKASKQFDLLLGEQLSEALNPPDVYFYAGHSNLLLFFSQNTAESLAKAHTYFLTARRTPDQHKDWSGYPNVLNMLGVTYQLLPTSGAEVRRQNLQESVAILTEAAKKWKDRNVPDGYFPAQSNLAVAYRLLAIDGLDPQTNFVRSLELLKESAAHAEETKDWGGYASDNVNIGNIFLELAQRNTDVIKNLHLAIDHLQRAARYNKLQVSSSTYEAAQYGLFLCYDALVGRGIDVYDSLSNSAKARLEIAAIYREEKKWAKYANIQRHIASVYYYMFQQGQNKQVDLQNSITALKEAIPRYKDLENWNGYADVQFNLGVAHWELSQHGIEVRENFELAEQAFEEGAAVFHRLGLSEQEKRFTQALDNIHRAVGQKWQSERDWHRKVTTQTYHHIPIRGLQGWTVRE